MQNLQALGGILMKRNTIVIIDRFEEDWAVLEYEGIVFNVPRALLPDDAKEGDVINIILEINRQETHKRREFIRKLEDELFE
jgi:hypothetical protein